MSDPELIVSMLPADLRQEFESLRVECLELMNRMPLSEMESTRAKLILHRMNELIDSRAGARGEGRHTEEILDLFREEMNADESDKQ